MVETIAHLLVDQPQCKRISDNARRLTKEHYTWDIVEQSLCKAIHEVLSP